MNHDETVKNPPPANVDPISERDLAPVPMADKATAAADLDVVNVARTPEPEKFIPPATAHKKPSSAGIKLFNFLAYGGFALIGNELLSNQITQYFRDKPSLLAKLDPQKKGPAVYQKFKNYFKESGLPEYAKEGRMLYVLLATVGGMLTVIPVKWMEDSKGKIVRTFDRWIHGQKESETNPKLIEAHKEMDAAPKQSWSTLGKGRLVVVATALSADAVMGWKQGITANLAKGTKLEKWASLDHVSARIAEAVTKDKESLIEAINDKIDLKLPVAEEELKRAKRFGQAENLTWLFTLSATCAFLFYLTSKLFAKKGHEKVEQKVDKVETHLASGDKSSADAAPMLEATAHVGEKPHALVNNVASREVLKPAEQRMVEA
jgi:hypothetical protein